MVWKFPGRPSWLTKRCWKTINKMYRIHLARMGKTFEAEPDEIVLDAAERAGIVLAFSCRSGTWRSWMAGVLSGCLEHGPEFGDELHIGGSEMDGGYRLFWRGFGRFDGELGRLGGNMKLHVYR